MLQSSIENSIGLMIAFHGNMDQLQPQVNDQDIESFQNQQQIDDISGELDRASSNGSLLSDSQQISTEDYSEAISIEQNIMTQHLLCLESMVFKISQKLFKIAFDFDGKEVNKQVYHQYEPSLKQYLLAEKSLIPTEFVQHFIQFLEKHVSFTRALEWIYHHARPQLGDEMILIAHKAMLAYLPIKHSIHNQQQIVDMVQQPFNLLNIYNDSRLKMLNIGKLYPDSKGFLQFNSQLYAFHQEFLQTLLLVLEQYFENPGYSTAIQENQKRQRKIPTHSKRAPEKKTKRIHKISRDD